MFIPLIIFIAGATFGAPAAASAPETVAVEAQSAEKPESLGEYVKEYFSDEPILAEIAQCESHMRQTDESGNILRGDVDSDDIGVMQINTRYHLEDSKELGLDIYSLDGNLAYAKYLYEKQGTKPWKASQPCWGKVASR